MTFIWISLIVFVFLTVLPIAFSAAFYKRKQGAVLHINQDRNRQPRYFGTSFAGMIKRNLPRAVNKIKLSKLEEFVEGEAVKGENETVSTLVINREGVFAPPSTVRLFEKEIYSAEDVALRYRDVTLRAAFAERNMLIGDGVNVIRWVDAGETMAVYNNCNLGISATAEERLSVGVNCKFRRLYAREICLGQIPERLYDPMSDKDPKIFRLPVFDEVKRNITSVNMEKVNDDGVAEYSIVSRFAVDILEDVIVQGDIRSHGDVYLHDNCVVCGNVFAERDVHLGRNAAILGNVFCQGSVYMEERSMVGRKGRICSVVARDNITVEPDCTVYGFMSCERGGSTVLGSREEEDYRIKPNRFRFLPGLDHLEDLSFGDVWDYEHVDRQGFRKEPALERVTIPAGALEVPDSMFFGCRQLKTLELPNSIEEIGDYAFADCRALELPGGLKNPRLKRIGTAAFENCASLERLQLPASLVTLEGAAFSGCGNLQKVSFAPNAKLQKIGDHAFRGCRNLKELHVPDSVTYIGVSAFKECRELRFISVPEHCAQEPGVLELNRSRVNVMIRSSASGAGD